MMRDIKRERRRTVHKKVRNKLTKTSFCAKLDKRQWKWVFFLCLIFRNKRGLVAGNRNVACGRDVNLPEIKDTWRWRSRARKNNIGMYGM